MSGNTIIGTEQKARCAWVGSDAEYERYHDEEWGVPLHGDRALFEKLTLEAFQAGLSWITILRKREAFRTAFQRFDIDRVAALRSADIDALMTNTAIVRNRAKITAARNNAQITLAMVKNSPGAFDELLWSFRPDTAPRARHSLHEIPTQSAESTAMSMHLKSLGYRFVGPTSMYALMQSTGMVSDHVAGCWLADGQSATGTRNPND